MMSASTPAPLDPDLVQTLGIDLVVGAVMLAAVGFLFVWALVIVSKREPGAMLAVSIALLTLVAIGVYAVTQSEVMGTLAATGMGALAGSLTAIFRARQTEVDEEPPTRQERDESAESPEG